jgi:hypothetical protein
MIQLAAGSWQRTTLIRWLLNEIVQVKRLQVLRSRKEFSGKAVPAANCRLPAE